MSLKTEIDLNYM